MLALHHSLIPTYGPPQEGNITTLKIPHIDAPLDEDVAVLMGLPMQGSHMGKQVGHMLGEIAEDERRRMH